MLLEAKASRTPTPQMGEPLVRLSKAVSDYRTECFVVHRFSAETKDISALRPGVSALSLQNFGSSGKCRGGW